MEQLTIHHCIFAEESFIRIISIICVQRSFRQRFYNNGIGTVPSQMDVNI